VALLRIAEAIPELMRKALVIRSIVDGRTPVTYTFGMNMASKSAFRSPTPPAQPVSLTTGELSTTLLRRPSTVTLELD
jgi:hypothetical protein